MHSLLSTTPETERFLRFQPSATNTLPPTVHLHDVARHRDYLSLADAACTATEARFRRYRGMTDAATCTHLSARRVKPHELPVEDGAEAAVFALSALAAEGQTALCCDCTAVDRAPATASKRRSGDGRRQHCSRDS
jgi:hypothetical protein